MLSGYALWMVGNAFGFGGGGFTWCGLVRWYVERLKKVMVYVFVSLYGRKVMRFLRRMKRFGM